MILKNEIKHIAALARIGINDKEIEKFSKEFSGILDWINQLNEVETKNIEPIGHITGLKNVMREDKVSEFENRESIKKLFPEEKEGYDKVKSVL